MTLLLNRKDETFLKRINYIRSLDVTKHYSRIFSIRVAHESCENIKFDEYQIYRVRLVHIVHHARAGLSEYEFILRYSAAIVRFKHNKIVDRAVSLKSAERLQRGNIFVCIRCVCARGNGKKKK
uniref:Uncharacterized protein n=1 Tax=Sipha flava TaxID=143950 RepID=A0A2S2R5P0_9HEMI